MSRRVFCGGSEGDGFRPEGAVSVSALYRYQAEGLCCRQIQWRARLDNQVPFHSN